jgi:hypothetical protein
MLPAARACPFTADSLVYSGRGLFFGYSIRNTHATVTATVDFYDGTSTAGVLIGSVDCLAVRSENVFPSSAAVRTEAGLYIDGASATCTVIPYYMTQTRLMDGLTLFDDEDRNLDELGLARLMAFLESSLPTPAPAGPTP